MSAQRDGSRLAGQHHRQPAAWRTFRSSLTEAYRRDLGTQMVAAYQACPSCSPASSGEKMGAMVGPCADQGRLSQAGIHDGASTVADAAMVCMPRCRPTCSPRSCCEVSRGSATASAELPCMLATTL